MRKGHVHWTYSMDKNRNLASLVVACLRPTDSEKGSGSLLIIRVRLYSDFSAGGAEAKETSLRCV
jgi:hypothetical protein